MQEPAVFNCQLASSPPAIHAPYFRKEITLAKGHIVSLVRTENRGTRVEVGVHVNTCEGSTIGSEEWKCVHKQIESRAIHPQHALKVSDFFVKLRKKLVYSGARVRHR